ncbi:hypothetical protein [Bacteroides sp.]|uniref:hypothetical protein n=1 Tax=Bacteroides sp. TaxID=29523 RepID=UPI0026196633|nr:hypothetical protein [Bacteroides sp.]
MKDSLDHYIACILLDNIMRVMSDITFGKDLSAYIVGGEKKLVRLIEAGEIECDKPCNSQNGKWYCNAAQVLKHCRCMRKNFKPNKSKK